MCKNRTVYDELVANGTIIPAQEVPPPTVPMDYSWARVRILIFFLKNPNRSLSLSPQFVFSTCLHVEE